MSYRYERYETQSRRRGGYGASGQRTTFGYWVPLVLTVTAATVGLAAWIWSERRDDDDDYPDGRRDYRPPPVYGDVGPGETSFGRSVQPTDLLTQQVEDESMIARMSGALRRTPSPQQIFDGASRKVAAGVAAAGAMVGGALSSIREEEKGDYEDHTRWSEEAETRGTGIELRSDSGVRGAPTGIGPAAGLSGRSTGSIRQRKSVAIVVSSVADHDAFGNGHGTYGQEHAVSPSLLLRLYNTDIEKSILAHLPAHHDSDTTRVFVLIYAPDLKQHPLSSSPPSRPTVSMTSSFSNIGHDEAHTPGEEGGPLASLDPRPVEDSSSPLFKTLYRQAQALVEKETMIIPFTTPTGHVHLLRHLGPETVYIQESLCGNDGDAVSHISGWVRQVVVVVGDEGGHGALIDSEDEVGLAAEKGEKWWQKPDRVGLGKRVDVVDGLRAGEDWRRRITGHE
jgi:hypothetical protein